MLEAISVKTTLLYTNTTYGVQLCHNSIIIIIILLVLQISDNMPEIILQRPDLLLGVETFEDLHTTLSVEPSRRQSLSRVRVHQAHHLAGQQDDDHHAEDDAACDVHHHGRQRHDGPYS